MALANTNSLKTNFFIDPYYDDFNEDKNFHRILFRPGQAVQARELTQIQSMLQNQIDRFAEHIFKEGTIVTGCPLNYLPRTDYIQIRDTDQLGNTINVSAFSNVQLTSSATGVTANTILVASGSESSNVKNTLYINYTSVSPNGSISTFQSGELITADNATKTANVITSTASIGQGTLVRFGEGVIFAKDNFIKVPEQTIVVGEYSSNVSYRVGFTVNESIITSAEDTSLLDPAQGAFNYTAPGANRLKLTATLERKSLADTSLSDFVEVLRIRKGTIEYKAVDTRYSEIDNYIARRTFKESGHYVADGLNLRLREHLNQSNNQGVFTAGQGGNTSQLVTDVSPGTAYVFGYEQVSPSITHIALDKGLDFNTINEATTTTNYGNFVNVKNVVGAFDINSHNTVSLRDEFMNPIANNNFSIQNATGNEIGTARVRALDYTSGSKGSPDAQYKLYLYDVQMSNAAFTAVKSIQAGGTTANAKADIILNSSSNAIANETNFNIGVFELPANAVRRLRDSTGAIDNSFIFNQSFGVTISSAGTFTLTTNDSNERFLDTGVQNATQKNQNFYIVLNGTATSAGAVDTGSMSDGANTISGLTAADTKFNVGERIALAGHANTFVISSVSATSMNTFTVAQAAISSQAITKVLAPGTVINMAGVGGSGAARTLDVDTATTADFDLKETFTSGVSATVHAKLNKVAAREKSKTFNSSRYVMINTASNPGGTAGPWNLGLADVFKVREVRKNSSRHTAVTDGIDVTSDFVLDNGQRDNLYSLARITKNPNSNLSVTSGDHLLIKLDFFSEDTSQGAGYYSVDSYPIDDSNAANTTAITTAEIPTFISPTSGDEFKLRDSIDIRPRITDTANNTTSLTLISTNPANTFTVLEGTGNGLRYAYPNENFTVDLSFYLGRIDKVAKGKEGNFRVIPGTSSKSPIAPVDQPDAFTIGRVNISPYPSIITADPYYRQGANSSILTYVIEDRVEGYTMADIGILEDRIGVLEYYTSLNLLEQSTQSLQVTDGAGLNRFKSGFLVENFTDGYKADLGNQDFKILIDADATEGIPREFTKFTKLEEDTANSSGVTRNSGDVILTVSSEVGFTTGETISIGGVSGSLRYEVTDGVTNITRLYLENVTGTFPSSGTVTGGTSGKTTAISSVAARPDGFLVTLDYSHDPIINNFVASGTRNAAGAFWNWIGALTLTPDQDFWIDTINLPPFRRTVTVNIGSVAGGFNGTREVSRSIQRSSAIEASYVQPFIRAQTIQFRGDGLKPNSILYPYFDNVDVSSRVRPANSSLVATGARGSTLQAGTDGTVFGFLDLPNDNTIRFNTGTKILRLSDNQFNSAIFGQFTTEASAKFVADGLIQEVRETIVTTRRVQTVFVPPPPPPRDRGGGRDDSGGGLGGFGAGQDGRGDNGDTGRGYGDPIAQSFLVNDPDNPSANIRRNPTTSAGMFCTKIDLFFATKSDTYGVEISIREMDPSGNFPTGNIVPFSKKILQPSEINARSTTPVPTPVFFDTPIYLLTNEQYCFVVKPVADNPDTTVWISRLGENDIITGNRITSNPYGGILFISANDRTWTPVQQEDLTFRMYFADFDINQSGTLAVTNEAAEYFNISTSNTDSNITRNMTVHGETTLLLKSTPTANVGELIVGATSNAVGTITSISSNTFTLKSVSLNEKFANNEVVNFQFANGLSTAGSHNANSTIFTASFPAGVVDVVDRNAPEGGRIVLTNVTGTFGANSQFREQDNGLTGVIDSTTNLPIDEFVVNFGVLDLDGTTSSVTGKLATSTTTRDSDFNRLQKNTTTIIDARKFILGNAQETAGIGGAKSADLRFTLTNTINNRHSPAIDVGRLGIVTSEFFINNLSTNETSTSGGDATTRYISKVVTLEDGLDAEDMRLLVTAYKPSVANIRVYGKFLNALDNDTIDQRPYEELTLTTVSTLDSKDEDRADFKEFEYNMPASMLTGSSNEYQYTSGAVTYTGYKYFKIKIVLTTSNTAKAPRLKDYRAIALQK